MIEDRHNAGFLEEVTARKKCKQLGLPWIATSKFCQTLIYCIQEEKT